MFFFNFPWREAIPIPPTVHGPTWKLFHCHQALGKKDQLGIRIVVSIWIFGPDKNTFLYPNSSNKINIVVLQILAIPVIIIYSCQWLMVYWECVESNGVFHDSWVTLRKWNQSSVQLITSNGENSQIQGDPWEPANQHKKWSDPHRADLSKWFSIGRLHKTSVVFSFWFHSYLT